MPPVRAAPPYPRGFFVEDLSKTPSTPAFYNLETHKVESFSFRQSFEQYIEFAWDRERGRVFFSARRKPKELFRIYLKDWPDGEEKSVYENPIGAFRFLLSPDGRQIALQIQGPQAWPTIAVHTWEEPRTLALGQGHSPDWSPDGSRLLFLEIPGSLPSYLAEYRVETSSVTRALRESVMEAVYTADPDQIILKTAGQFKSCDMFQVWNRRTKKFKAFSPVDGLATKKSCPIQRDIGSFPGHQFFFFHESRSVSENDRPTLVVTDVWGGRLQSLSPDDWQPRASAVEETTLVLGEDPLYLTQADGAGGAIEIPKAGFIRLRR